MISRRRKILLIQLTIFLLASSLLFYTYRDKSNKIDQIVKIEVEADPDTNRFTDIEYSGFDFTGNRYTLNAGKADFKTETPESIEMQEVVANFYLKNGSVLKVVSSEGIYNNITLDMKFNKNVKSTYLTNILLSDTLDYSNSNGKLLASGNVRGESIEKGKFTADNVEYNLSDKNLDFSMLDGKQINVKIKN